MTSSCSLLTDEAAYLPLLIALVQSSKNNVMATFLLLKELSENKAFNLGILSVQENLYSEHSPFWY